MAWDFKKFRQVFQILFVKFVVCGNYQPVEIAHHSQKCISFGKLLKERTIDRQSSGKTIHEHKIRRLSRVEKRATNEQQHFNVTQSAGDFL